VTDQELDNINLEELIERQALKPDVSAETEDEKLQGEIKQIMSVPKDKPDISRLQDAVTRNTDGKLIFIPEVGGKVIIERTTDLGDGNRVWLDTETFRVESIDPETGHLRLINFSLRCAAQSNFITGLERGYLFKLPGSEGNVGKRRRGRPKKPHRGLEDLEPQTTPQQKVPGKKRGRPKGSLNRDKATIAKEKAERQAKRQVKRAKRESRLRGRLSRG
jgi:hypothetical protein